MVYENKITQIGYVSNIKEIGKMMTASLGIGVKQQDNTYKNGFLEIRGSKETLGEIAAGDRVKVDGFISFNFWQEKETGKEMQKITMVVNSVLEIEKKDEDAKKEMPKKETKSKTTKATKKVVEEPKDEEEELPAYDIDEDEYEEKPSKTKSSEKLPVIEVDEDEIPF